jgi:hypothetical protein
LGEDWRIEVRHTETIYLYYNTHMKGSNNAPKEIFFHF